MANIVYAHTSAGGSVTADRCLYTQTANEGGGKRTAALCHEDGCRLTAAATGSYAFVGWYADAAYSRLLSSSESYNYVPRDSHADIYARFRVMETPLDSKGTANCYIAPALDTRYSFDATVQGNGKNTTKYLAAAASRSFRPRALGIGDIERNGCQRCGVLKRPYILFDGSRAGQRRDRVVRRCGKLHLVVAYLVGRLRPGNHGADLFIRGRLYGPQYRSTHHRLHAALIARALLPNGAAKTPFRIRRLVRI